MIKRTTILKHLLPAKRKLNTKQTHFTSPPSLSPLYTILFLFAFYPLLPPPPPYNQISTRSPRHFLLRLPPALFHFTAPFYQSSTFTPRDNEKTALLKTYFLLLTFFLMHTILIKLTRLSFTLCVKVKASRKRFSRCLLVTLVQTSEKHTLLYFLSHYHTSSFTFFLCTRAPHKL